MTSPQPGRVLLRPLVLLFLLAPFGTSTHAAPPDAGHLLKKYCAQCHSPDKHEAGVVLRMGASRKQMLNERGLWARALHQLESEEMPPDEPLPTDQERALLARWIREQTAVDWSRVKHSGRVTIPRLTRAEYNNTMRDLLGVDLDPGDYFSADGQGESGFTTDRDGLFLTPTLMEKYLESADRSLNAALALEEGPKVLARLESENMFMTETKETPKQLSDDFFGFVLNRGQMTLYDSIEIPHDGYYRFRVRVASTGNATATRLRINDQVMGDIQAPSRAPIVQEMLVFIAQGAHQMAWNIEAPNRSLQATPVTKPESEETGAEASRGQNAAENRRSKAKPPVEAATKHTKLPPNANALIDQRSPASAPQWVMPAGVTPELAALVQRVNTTSISIQRPYEWLRLHGANGDPAQINRFRGYIAERTSAHAAAKQALAEALNIPVAEFNEQFEAKNEKRFADRRRLLAAVAKVAKVAKAPKAVTPKNNKPGSVAIDWIEVSGPHRPQGSGASIVTHWPSKTMSPRAAATKVLENFAKRAFRRPLGEGELESRLGVFDRAHSRGDSYLDSLRLAMTSVLISPHFVYRVELAPAETVDKPFLLSDVQLASRLSYMLWMSMPDERLMTLAESGELSDEATLRSEVGRLLSDPRAMEFYETFTGQWLGFDELGKSITPDANKFPMFDGVLTDAMKAETVLYFRHLVHNNESLLRLLDSDETFLNQRLASHYGIQDVRHAEMQLTKLTNSARGGLLGMGSILTATSSPQRTSPVIRGKWILETLLGETIPEPPADAGELPPDAGESKSRTLREELLHHRRNPSCASCHDRIDPVGFGLEMFDAIGRERTRQANKPIDIRGQLSESVTFQGAAELKKVLSETRREPFLRNLTERLVSYALGRKLELYDEPALRTIIGRVRDDNYGARRLVEEVVMSYPFRHQSTERPDIDTMELPPPAPNQP